MPIEFGAGVEVRLEQPGMPTFRLPPPQAPGVKLVAVTGPAGSGVETLGPRVDELELQVDALEVSEVEQDIRLAALEATPPVAEKWWTGEGPPPAVISGASPGDMYIDQLTGTLYRLQ
jgi:hypothetical protein